MQSELSYDMMRKAFEQHVKNKGLDLDLTWGSLNGTYHGEHYIWNDTHEAWAMFANGYIAGYDGGINLALNIKKGIV